MGNEISASEYFLRHRPDSGGMRVMYARIARSMMLNDVTMSVLCKATDEELSRLRGIGEKAQAIIREECRRYLQEIDQ